MADTLIVPDSLMNAIQYFSDQETSVRFMARLRWADGPECPRCKSKRLSFVKTRLTWTCLECRKQFSVKVGTIFEDSAIGLDKWLCALWMIANCKNGISSYEIGKDLGVTQKSAWFMLHRIRYAMKTGTFAKLSGHVEADETFIGAKARNMHANKRAQKIHGRGPTGKTIVMGAVERGGEVRAAVVPTRRKGSVQSHIREHVMAGAALYTDALKSYNGLDEFQHQVIDHAVAYADGQVHTNTMENFWSLLKRGLHGTYVSVEPYHLHRYLDEQAFRYNKRHSTDADRFVQLCSMVAGKRLTWNEVTGKNSVDR
jgi:transposase-like protein